MRGSPTIGLVLVAAGLFLAPAGCRKKQPVLVAPPPAPTANVAPPPEAHLVIVLPMPPPPTPAPAEPRLSACYLEGERLFETGDYVAAGREYELFLRDDIFAPNRDRAHFRLGLSYALAGATPQSRRRAADQFRQLVKLHPESPYRPAAEIILRLQDEIAGLLGETEKLKRDARAADERIKNLNEELERLKLIDLTRKPTKPPG